MLAQLICGIKSNAAGVVQQQRKLYRCPCLPVILSCLVDQDKLFQDISMSTRPFKHTSSGRGRLFLLDMEQDHE
jgi:hypothetical protein